jgi:hypothetical protein
LRSLNDIIDYNIYFISINSQKDIEEDIYSTFTPYDGGDKINTYFLKASSPYNAYKVFFANSYLPKKFIIDPTKSNLELLELK